MNVNGGWNILMALEIPPHMLEIVMARWKRESRGEVSRVRKGFVLANEHMLRVHVSTSKVGLLEKVHSYNGNPKQIPASFWEDL